MQTLIKKIIDHTVFRCGIIGEVLCPPDWKVDGMVMQDFDLWFVRSGKGSLECDGKRSPVEPGHLFLFRPGQRITAEQNPENPLYVYYCHFDALNNPLFRRLRMPPLTPDKEGRIVTAFEMFSREARQDAEITNFTIRLLLYSLFQIWLEEDQLRLDAPLVKSGHMDTLFRAIDYLSLHLDRKMNLDELSRLCAMEKSGLSRLFREYTGKSPIRYHAELKMQHAALLLETGSSVKETASRIGYQDPFSFSKAFKKHRGLSPSEFIRVPAPKDLI